MDIARGASGIIYKSRIAFTLLNATSEDCETFGIQDHERTTYVRLDDAKMNLALASGEPLWFRRSGVKIASQDVVGVITPTELKADSTTIRTRLAQILTDALTANGQATMTLQQAVAVVKQQEPLYANKTDLDVRKKMEGLFVNAVEHQGKSLQVKRDGDSVKAPLIFVMS
jgi:hypothetical protein